MKQLETGLAISSEAKDIQQYIRDVNSAISDGEIDPTQALIYTTKAIKFYQGIKDYAKLVAVGKIDKHQIYHSAKLSQATTPTKWDYKKCNDPVLNRLNDAVKLRQEWLQSLEEPYEHTDEDTGEITIINPPSRLDGTHYIKCEVV